MNLPGRIGGHIISMTHHPGCATIQEPNLVAPQSPEGGSLWTRTARPAQHSTPRKQIQVPLPWKRRELRAVGLDAVGDAVGEEVWWVGWGPPLGCEPIPIMNSTFGWDTHVAVSWVNMVMTHSHTGDHVRISRHPCRQRLAYDRSEPWNSAENHGAWSSSWKARRDRGNWQVGIVIRHHKPLYLCIIAVFGCLTGLNPSWSLTTRLI